jgi:hypothetical protein
MMPTFQVVGELLKVDHNRALKDVGLGRLPFSEAPTQFTPWVFTEEKYRSSSAPYFGYTVARKSMRVEVRYREKHVAKHSDRPSPKQDVREQFSDVLHLMQGHRNSRLFALDNLTSCHIMTEEQPSPLTGKSGRLTKRLKVRVVFRMHDLLTRLEQPNSGRSSGMI